MAFAGKDDEVSASVLSNEGHRCRVRVTVTRRGKAEVVEAEIDASDTSPLALKAAQYGGLPADRLARVRAQIVRRALERAEIDAVAAHDAKEPKGGR